MAVSKSKKIDILENLKKSIKEAKSVSFTTNNGLTVEEITKLRKDLREVNTSFTLVKKTLIKIAFKEVYNVEIDDSILNGQIAVVCSNDDAVAGLGKVNEFIKSYKKDPKIIWAGSYFDGEIKNAEDTTNIASIPSKDVLLSRLIGSMMSPISALARFFDAAAKKLDNEGMQNLASTPSPKKEEKAEEEKQEVKKTPKEDTKNEEKVKEERNDEEAKVEEIKESKKEEEKEETTKEENPKEESTTDEKIEE